MTRLPYKLLDYYRFEDADLFFGREEETRKMVGEILSSRLLVLFSPSGSGKTSLINAGVRPQMEEMGYKTIYTRLEDEPIISVCKAVAESLELPDCQEREELYEYLKKAAQSVEKPLVIFLDQFEEFFIVFRDQQKLRQEFIKQVARIKYDDQLPVFLVLSLREDYFANLHEFREDIPSIFQNNANIRLEPFTEKAARRAIEEPLKAVGYNFEKGMVDILIKDLKTGGGGIEPIKSQLVCSTLWNNKPEDSKPIPLSTYEVCGGAEKIFSNFIYERLSRIPQRQHKLMVRIFESLKTPDNTKRYRSFEDLQSQLKIKKTKRLAALLQRLSGFDVLRQEGRKGTKWYEFKHDYVVDEINQWIKEHQERINRKRLFYATISPIVILLVMLFSYAFIQYNTFYAGFTSKDYDGQQEEIVISRGIDPLGEHITTGLLIENVKDLPMINDLRVKLRIGFWNKNNWANLAATLPIFESGKFLYRIGWTKLGIERLIDALKENNVRVRDPLVRLGKEDKNVIDALIQVLKDEDLFVQRMAAGLLVRLGKADKNVIDALIQALKDESSNIRHWAAKSLGGLGEADETVIDALIMALKDEYSFVRRKAADSLVRLGQADKNVIDALIMALKDESSYVRLQAADSLGRLGQADKNVIDALIMALKDESSYVRLQAADSLVRLGKADKTVIKVLLLALKDDDSFVRRKAADSLGRLGKADKNVIEALIPALKDKDYDVRRKAADSLGRLGQADKNVIDALIMALKDKDYDVRRKAADSLGRLGQADKNVIDALILVLKDKDSDVRRKAADLLGNLGKTDQTMIDALFLALKDESSYVRLQAANSLVRLRKVDKTVIEVLVLALKDESSYVRRMATDSLGRVGKADKIVIEALILALKDQDSSVRFQAADSLGRVGKADKTMIEALLMALKDEGFNVRQKAAASLGILWQKKSETELIELLKHPLSGYRTGAAYALKHKKSLSQKTLDEIDKLKDKDPRPWVRLGAWKAFELIQEKKEEEENKDLGE